jgi:phosphoribosylformylglycinamidine cyclo-ligase
MPAAEHPERQSRPAAESKVVMTKERREIEKGLSYSATGVDIGLADAVKRRMARLIDSNDPRVLNKLGAFASLVEGSFPGIDDPVLVLKTEEPGSKQKLAFDMDRVESICHDMVNHLVNDVAVMGAHPLYVLDCIVCGRLDSDIIDRLVAGMAEACRAQECVLVGGETSVQPGVVPAGLYVISATAVGVADRSAIVDGSGIQAGDAVLAVASNGLHTNGYTLVRALLQRRPEVASLDVDGETFSDVIMRSHTCYYLAMRGLFGRPGLHGFAHITGGGLRDNLLRILPPAVEARIDLSQLRVPRVFRIIWEQGEVGASDMLRTYNMGCGLVVICSPTAVDETTEHFAAQGHECWRVGEVVQGSGDVVLIGEIAW